MLAQHARLLAFYAGLVYNSWKTQDYHRETQHVQKLNMIFFISSGEKSSQPKNFHLYNKRAMLFIDPNKTKDYLSFSKLN